MTQKEFSFNKYFIYAFIVLLIGITSFYHEKIMSFFKKENSNENNKIMAIIGIDIGSTTSGFNIIIKPFENPSVDESGLIDSQIIIHKNSKDGLFIGKKAYENYIADPYNKNNLYFTLFKRNLDPKINKNMVASDYPGDELEIEIIIKEFLRKLKQIIEDINQIINDANSNDIRWIITVPPLWDIKGKKSMEQAAKKAGMVNLEVVLEPEAASLAIFNEDNPKIKKFIQPGKKFLIVDAGGYTIDFSANKILENNNLEQLMIPASIVNGSSILNEKIFDLVKKFIGQEKVNKVYKTEYSIIKKLLVQIEEIKKQVNDDASKSFGLDISYFNMTCPKEGWFNSKKKECEKEVDGIKLSHSEKTLFIPKEYIYNLILETSKTIINHINFVLSKIGEVDLIIYTGGFSNNKIFQKIIEKHKKGDIAEAFFLKDPQKTVQKGAALFGLNSIQIIQRIIPITIGIESYEIKNKNTSEEENICENEYTDEKNQTRCQEYIRYVMKRESVKINETKEHSIHPLNERIIIYYSYEDEITNENKLELGFIDSPLSELPLIDRNLKINMKFSNYINVTIIDETENKENSVLLSYPINKFFENDEYLI